MMRSIFRKIELLVYYMVIVIAIEQIHSAVLDNLSLIKFSQSGSAFFFYKMNQLIVFPTATLWLLFSFFHPAIRFVIKMLFLSVWLAGVTFAYVLFQYVGIFRLTGWNSGYSLVFWYVVLLESLCFSLIIRQMLKRGSGDDPLPT